MGFQHVGGVCEHLVQGLLERMIRRRLDEFSLCEEPTRVLWAIAGLQEPYRSQAIEIMRQRKWVTEAAAEDALEALGLRER